ncbi:hypothetical protein AgCh_032684 [Apium graveolens]
MLWHPDFTENYQNADYLSERAILSPTNQTVGNLNSAIVDRIPGEMFSYFSVDTAEDFPGSQTDQMQSFPPEYLNSINIPGLALHELKLKVGVVVMLTRNLNQTLGLCNGTRMIVTSFDLFVLEDLEAMKSDNHFLTDVVSVIQQEPVKMTYIKDFQEKSHVHFSITDGRKVINVTFFNQFGESLLKAMDSKLEQPIIITICCVKVSDWKGTLYLTNFPSTRFYLNADHYSVPMFRKRVNDPNFYAMDINEEHDAPIPLMKVKDIRNLKDDYIEEYMCISLMICLTKHLSRNLVFVASTDKTTLAIR